MNGSTELNVQPDRASHYTPPMTPSSSGWFRINSEAPQLQLSQAQPTNQGKTGFKAVTIAENASDRHRWSSSNGMLALVV